MTPQEAVSTIIRSAVGALSAEMPSIRIEHNFKIPVMFKTDEGRVEVHTAEIVQVITIEQPVQDG